MIIIMEYIWWMLGYETEAVIEKPTDSSNGVAEANITREKRREESQKRRHQRKSYLKDKLFREAETEFKRKQTLRYR